MAASFPEGAALNPYSFKTTLLNGSSTFSIKGKPDFNNDPRGLPRNLPNWIILDSWVF